MDLQEDYQKSKTKLFRIDRNQEMKLEDFGNESIQTSIVYEMNLDLQKIHVQTYSFPDFLGDIGGLAYILSAILTMLVMVLTYNSAYHYITQAIYQIEEDIPQDK